MSLFSKLLGGGAKTPEALTSIADCGAALHLIEQERAITATSRAEMIERRREAILADEPDSKIAKIDADLDRLSLLEDRLDGIEPRIRARLAELRGEEKRAILAMLEREAETAVKALDKAAEALLTPFETVLEIGNQLSSAGFEVEARNLISQIPMLAGGFVASRENIERWRRAREHAADMKAAASRPYVPAPAPVTNVVPLRKPEPPTPYVSYQAPQPVKITAPIAPGFTRIEAIMSNIDGGELGVGRMLARGDQLDLPAGEAARVLKGAAFKYVAGAENVEDAAE